MNKSLMMLIGAYAIAGATAFTFTEINNALELDEAAFGGPLSESNTKTTLIANKLKSKCRLRGRSTTRKENTKKSRGADSASRSAEKNESSEDKKATK